MSVIANTAGVAQAVKSALPKSSRQMDVWLIGAVLVLLTFGLVMVYSATVASGSETLAVNFAPLVSHLVHIVLGLALIAALGFLRLDWWERYSKQLLVLSVLSLAIVLLPGVGVNVNGSTRWIALGDVRIQPAEFVKVFMVVYVASYLVRKKEVLGQFTEGVLVVGVVTAMLSLLLLIQPDFGSVVVISLTVISMLFLGGIRLGHFILCVTFAVTTFAILVWIEPYRLQRIMSFLNPWSDPFDTGFQLVQALIAFGRGEWFGVGLGASIQKLYYLPHASNDFLLAVIAEELGLIGVSVVVLLFAVLLWRAFVIARRAERVGMLFAARLAEGAGLLLVVQAMINMGVNMGLLPTKGLTLPMMSYGGSSILATCFALGLLFAIDRATQPQPGAER